jgi:hypothetical protein
MKHNSAGYSGEAGEHEVATPYNRPRPQWDMKSVVQDDPTSALLAKGGFLTLNDRDRAALSDWFQANFDGRFQGGLHTWFQNSFKNQFQFKVSWWTTDWFPKFFGPIRDRINENFDKTFESLRKHDEEVVHLRAENVSLKKEMHDWVNKKDVEFGREVLKLRNENIAMKKELTVTMQAVVEVLLERSIDQLKGEFSAEIMKMQNEVADVKKGFEVTKIVADAARVTEAGFAGLRQELATEIAKSREEMTRESRAAAKRASAAAAKPAPAGSKKS